MHRLLNTAAKRSYSRTLWVLIFALSATSHSWATLTASADRKVIDSNETLQLRVRYDGQVINSKPQFDVLEKDFNILSNSRQQQYHKSNGYTESFTDWNLTLAPKRTGRLLVPSIKYKKDISDAIQITVRKASPSSATDQPVYTETLIDKTAVYVQEQLLLTHHLYTSIQLSNLSIDELVVPGALVQKISENQFQKRIGQKNYIVVEIKYALFPQTSGKLDIPAIGFSAYEVSGNRQFAGYTNPGNRIIRNTDRKTVDIMAKPAHINADQWMPSSKLQINQQWSSDLDQLVVGEPITRTITLSAKGLTGAQILPLSLASSSDYKVYPDQAQLDERINAGGVTGIRQESFALVPNREGQIKLPEIAVRWWDTVNQRMQTAKLEAITLQVGAAISDNNTGPYLALIDRADNPQNSATPNVNSVAPESLLTVIKTSRLIQLSLAINTLLLALIVALLISRSNQRAARKAPDSETNSPRLTLKQRIKAIEIAARKADLAAVREGILDWGRSAFPEAKIKTLEEIAQLCGVADLDEQFRLLDESLYNRESVQQADLSLLIRRLKALDVPTAVPKSAANGLKPLYPNHEVI